MIELRMHMDLKPLEHLQCKSPKAFNTAQKKAAIQFLNWANNGSAKSSRKPPIKHGILRGSSSAFVGKELVQTFTQLIAPGSTERPTPAKSHNASDTTMTWVWNTDYATRMHEKIGGSWGPITLQDGDAGAKWVEEHLQKDKDNLMALIGKFYADKTGI